MDGRMISRTGTYSEFRHIYPNHFPYFTIQHSRTRDSVTFVFWPILIWKFLYRHFLYGLYGRFLYILHYLSKWFVYFNENDWHVFQWPSQCGDLQVEYLAHNKIIKNHLQYLKSKYFVNMYCRSVVDIVSDHFYPMSIWKLEEMSTFTTEVLRKVGLAAVVPCAPFFFPRYCILKMILLLTQKKNLEMWKLFKFFFSCYFYLIFIYLKIYYFSFFCVCVCI